MQYISTLELQGFQGGLWESWGLPKEGRRVAVGQETWVVATYFADQTLDTWAVFEAFLSTPWDSYITSRGHCFSLVSPL